MIIIRSVLEDVNAALRNVEIVTPHFNGMHSDNNSADHAIEVHPVVECHFAADGSLINCD